jgi:hypothetical protein
MIASGPLPISSPNSPKARPRWLRAVTVAVPVVLILGVLVVWTVKRSAMQTSSSSATVDTASPAPAVVAVPSGRLVVDAVPWAKIVRITDTDGNAIPLPGDPYTPLVLTLEPGRYSVELSHPDLGDETQRCEVEVSAQAPGECRPELVKIEIAQYLKEAGWR